MGRDKQYNRLRVECPSCGVQYETSDYGFSREEAQQKADAKASLCWECWKKQQHSIAEEQVEQWRQQGIALPAIEAPTQKKRKYAEDMRVAFFKKKLKLGTDRYKQTLQDEATEALDNRNAIQPLQEEDLNRSGLTLDQADERLQELIFSVFDRFIKEVNDADFWIDTNLKTPNEVFAYGKISVINVLPILVDSLLKEIAKDRQLSIAFGFNQTLSRVEQRIKEKIKTDGALREELKYNCFNPQRTPNPIFKSHPMPKLIDSPQLADAVLREVLVKHKSERTTNPGLAHGKSVADIARMHGVSKKVLERQLRLGIAEEMEHTDDPRVAKRISMDHLVEHPDYYDRLKKAGL